MINFYIPDFVKFEKINLALIDLVQQVPELFYDGVHIQSVYGIFGTTAWNAGKNIYMGTNEEEMKRIIEEFNNRNVKIRYVFTNSSLEDRDIYERMGNKMLSLANNGFNEVIVNTKCLEDYIRKNYNYDFVSSTTKCITDINQLNEEMKDYSMTVIDWRKNHDMEFLQSIQNKELAEILLFEYCYKECPVRQQHYKAVSNSQLVFSEKSMSCNKTKSNFFETIGEEENITVEELYQILVPMGFCNFKINGRFGHALNLIESYIYYMVKPEYKDIVRYLLLKEIIR